MVPRPRGMILGQGRVLGDGLSGQEGSYDLAERQKRFTVRRERSINLFASKCAFPQNDTSALAPGLTAAVGTGMPPERRA